MNSLNSKKGRNVILVTAAQGGSGRTMTAVALATFLTQYGTVAFIGNDIEGRGYFGTPEPLPRSDLSHPGKASWSGSEWLFFSRENLFLYDSGHHSDASDFQPVISSLKQTHDFVVVSCGLDVKTTGDAEAALSMRQLVDHAIVLYRQNNRSHVLTSILLKWLFLEQSADTSLLLPMLNFRADDREFKLWQNWTAKALACFSSALNAAEAVLRSRELQGAVGNLYSNTALSQQPYLGYGAVNIALNFSCTAPGWPAYAVNNLAKLVVAVR